MTLRLLLLLLVPVLASGCAFKSQNLGGATPYDYSEYETYDQPHGSAATYANLH